MSIIRNTYTYMDERMFLSHYKSLLCPHLEYYNQIWNPHLRKLIFMIENVQIRSTKLIPGYKELSYEERLKKLHLPTLAYRRLRGDMIEVFKILKNVHDPSLTLNLLQSNDRISRGNAIRPGHPMHDISCPQRPELMSEAPSLPSEQVPVSSCE